MRHFGEQYTASTLLRSQEGASPTYHHPSHTGQRTLGRWYGRPSRRAAMKSALPSHQASRSRCHRHAFVRQAAEQYRRDRLLPSGSSAPH